MSNLTSAKQFTSYFDLGYNQVDEKMIDHDRSPSELHRVELEMTAALSTRPNILDLLSIVSNLTSACQFTSYLYSGYNQVDEKITTAALPNFTLSNLR